MFARGNTLALYISILKITIWTTNIFNHIFGHKTFKKIKLDNLKIPVN